MDKKQIAHELTMYILDHIAPSDKPEQILKLIQDTVERYRNICDMVEEKL